MYLTLSYTFLFGGQKLSNKRLIFIGLIDISKIKKYIERNRKRRQNY